MGEIVQKQILAHSYIKLIHKEFILFFTKLLNIMRIHIYRFTCNVLGKILKFGFC